MAQRKPATDSKLVVMVVFLPLVSRTPGNKVRERICFSFYSFLCTLTILNKYA